jgi:hypothetical protein
VITYAQISCRLKQTSPVKRFFFYLNSFYFLFSAAGIDGTSLAEVTNNESLFVDQSLSLSRSLLSPLDGALAERRSLAGGGRPGRRPRLSPHSPAPPIPPLASISFARSRPCSLPSLGCRPHRCGRPDLMQ